MSRTFLFLAALFLLSVFFFGRILAGGYESDIQAHLIYAVLHEEGLYSNLQRPLFGLLLMPVFHIMEASSFHDLFGVSLRLSAEARNAFFSNLAKIEMESRVKTDLSSLRSMSEGSLVDLHAAGAILLAGLVTLSGWATLRLLRKMLAGRASETTLLFLTALLLIAGPLYAPFFNRHIYLGQGSPNAWHNPTVLTVKPLMILAIPLAASLLEDTLGPGSLLRVFSLTVLLGLSLLAKPNFVLAFAPALLIFLFWKCGLSGRAILRMLIIVVPVAGILLLQYHGTYEAGEKSGSGGIIFDFLGVWRLYSPNVFVSILLAVAFPLSVLIFRYRQIMDSKTLFMKLSLIFLLIALLQAASLAEAGPTYAYFNFMWGYQLALYAVFAAGLAEFMAWQGSVRGKGRQAGAAVLKASSSGDTTLSSQRAGERVFLGISALLLGLHAVSGFYYILNILFLEKSFW